MSPAPIPELPITALRTLRVIARAALLYTLVCAHPAGAATVSGLYEATVSLTDRSERGQAVAFQDAMRQVLVRVTGRRDAGEDPALVPIVGDARRFVQQFRVVGGNQFFAGFDGVRVERAIVDAGQPLWGHQRPATLVLLSAGEGSNRALVTGSSTGELKQAVVRSAQLRGLPIVWPDAARPVNLAELAGGGPEGLRAFGAQYGADAVLGGIASSASGALVRWTLVQGSETSEWRGSPEEGPQGAADWFARVFSSESAGDGAIVAIAVSGVSDLRAYAAVTEYLQSLTLVRELSVDEVASDSVVYRARVQGGGERLARAISLGTRLEPLDAGTAGGDYGSTLSFRYRP